MKDIHNQHKNTHSAATEFDNINNITMKCYYMRLYDNLHIILFFKCLGSLDFYVSFNHYLFFFSNIMNTTNKLLFLFGCAKYIKIKMSFIWPMHVLEFRSSVPLCTLVYKRM